VRGDFAASDYRPISPARVSIVPFSIMLDLLSISTTPPGLVCYVDVIIDLTTTAGVASPRIGAPAVGHDVGPVRSGPIRKSSQLSTYVNSFSTGPAYVEIEVRYRAGLEGTWSDG
jgi:hypothetical protein